MELTGKRALVTGGGRGIGLAIARALAARGASVTVSGRARGPIEEAAQAIGGRAVVCDLTDRAATDALVAEVGAVDILVNNAGVAESAPLAATDDAMWDRILELDATAPFRLVRALVPAMVAAGWGRVVNVASNAGLTGYGYTAAYCAAKHAMVGFTRALAIDLGCSGVTINAVCPGWVDTPMARADVVKTAHERGQAQADVEAAIYAGIPIGRMVSADECAALIAWLASPEAAAVTGEAYNISGGEFFA